MKDLVAKIAAARQRLEFGADPDEGQLLDIEAVARTSLNTPGESRGIMGRLFGFDPATLIVICQLVLLVLELVRQIRVLRKQLK